METEFTPLMSGLGGGLIGLSAVMLLAATGRIAGISGILARTLVPPRGDGGGAVRIAFLAGLLLAMPLTLALGQVPQVQISASLPLLAIAGLLVGFGAVHGGGCTSGHGVCGLSRLSPRSLVATVTFMATAAVTVFVLRHVLGGG